MASIANEVKVANLALTKLGADRIISITEDSENARKVNAVFELIRDEVLRQHTWNFALDRRELNRLTDTPAFGYSYYFQIPGDVLRIISAETSDIEFTVEGDRIATNEGTFYALCIIRTTDTTKWTTDFVTTFAARLAAELAYPIANSHTLAAQLMDIYIAKIREIAGVDSQEGSQNAIETTTWLTSRFTGT